MCTRTFTSHAYFRAHYKARAQARVARENHVPTVPFLLVALGLASSQLEVCSNYISTKDSICYEIFRRLERQIVDSEANLYSLRKVFYPTSKTEPTLVNVSYALQVSSVRNASCNGDPESGENLRYPRRIFGSWKCTQDILHSVSPCYGQQTPAVGPAEDSGGNRGRVH